MAGPKYPVTIRFRATRADARTLRKLAEHHQRNESDMLRLLVDEAWATAERVRAKVAKKRATR